MFTIMYCAKQSEAIICHSGQGRPRYHVKLLGFRPYGPHTLRSSDNVSKSRGRGGDFVHGSDTSSCTYRCLEMVKSYYQY